MQNYPIVPDSRTRFEIAARKRKAYLLHTNAARKRALKVVARKRRIRNRKTEGI